MPDEGIAAKTALMPYGMKPPADLRSKLAPWNLKSKTMIARTGIATFHHVIASFTRVKTRMARKFTAVKIAIRAIVSRKPAPVTTPFVGLYRPWSKYERYSNTAKHSTGATVTAWSHEKKPKAVPAVPPKAKWGNRAVPPDTGNMAPSSAWQRARMMMATPPMSQPISAAGPAATDA